MEYKKILVPAGGGEADRDAMELACSLAKKDKGKIWSVYVITIKRALPVNAEVGSEIEEAEGVLNRMEDVAENLDYDGLDTDVLQARDAGPAIVDEAVERGVDLIVMALHYKRRFGQFNLGHVVPYVLKNAPCPVILLQK
jgi:nucleotide-binding universal stress UspA family protein